MKIYRIISDTKLFHFDDAIGRVPILGKALGEWQNEIVLGQGYSIEEVTDETSIIEQEYIIFKEDLFFTQAFFEEALVAAQKSTSSLQFCLEDNDFNQRFVLPFSKEKENVYIFDFKYVNKEEALQSYYISQKLYDFEVKLPEQIVKGGTFSMPQCASFAAHIISPFHLLQVNMAMNLNRSIAIQKGKIQGRFKHLKGKVGVFFFYSALKRLNKIGKNCFIHPTALIEGSVIGDNVKIGAYSIIRLSHVGNDCTISDNVVVANSVLGDKTHIANSNFIELSMTYEEAFLIHGPYQFSIFGRNSACFAVINCDFRLDQENIKIPTAIGIVDSRQPLLGIAYGHNSKTGGGSIIAAGRIVPNNKHIYPPDSIHLKFDK